jgi:hypothetical protein
LTVRLRPACWPTMRAATPSFRNEETLLTVLDFNSLRRYNGATDERRTVRLRMASNVVGRRFSSGGTSGSTTQATDERARRRD